MIETSLFAQGWRVIAGVDEAGRGACAGPLVAAAVVLDENSPILELGVLDSKMLTEKRREEIFEFIKDQALGFNIVVIEPQVIDQEGLQEMNIAALRRAAAGLAIDYDYLISDGYPLDGISVPTLGMFKGDALSVVVGAASILAKVTRDRMMIELDKKFPGYGLAKNKGYASAAHTAAMHEIGVSEIHRRSYRNVAAIIKG